MNDQPSIRPAETLVSATQLTNAITIPEYGQPVELARGVYLLRMPMPFRLNHINLYLLEDAEGWTLVDCGLNTPESKAVWEHVLATFLSRRPLIRIVVTHLHPDHIGCAQWLHEKTGAQICMTPGEWRLAREVFHLPVANPRRIEDHYRLLGLEDVRLTEMIKLAAGYRKMVKVLPENVSYLHEHETLDIGGRHWRILFGHGHSPACACLWDEAEQLLIVGDHVLPTISPNVNLLSVGPSNPLDDYLTSLGTFRNLPCSLVMPAHGTPSSRFRERIDELIHHHTERLHLLESACSREARTAAECVPLLFAQELHKAQPFFALGESAAHLVYLAERGSLKKEGEHTWTFAQQ